jgi:sulfane dehydrogenase subunit SoxC
MNNDQFKNESVYDQDRIERHLWQLGRKTGFTRRQVFKLMAAGFGISAAGGIIPATLRRAWAAHSGSVVKPTPSDLFITLGTNREMRWEAMRTRGYLVPNELFFVRNHTSTPHIHVDTWRLHVEGLGVSNPIELSYDDIVSMGEEDSETKFIECAGNGRSFFDTQQGRPASGTQWKLGAVGVAEWTGVPLGRILELAGLKSTAVDVMPEGLDPEVTGQGHVRRPIPIEKALEDDTLLVYGMNGQPLPEDHGFPVRLLVPGWVGIANIKWVGRIEVSEEPLFSPWNTTSYRLFGNAYAPDFPVLTHQEVKSAFELPFPAELRAGWHILTGRSWSGHSKIKRVEVSFDGGTHWLRAQRVGRNISNAWVRWAVKWYASPGQHILKARATDKEGNVQPETVPFNTQGYSFWAVVNHPVTVV